MLEFCLLVLPWMADPAIFERSRSDVTTPLATCVRPAALVFEANTVCALSPRPASDPKLINKWLKRWESATRNVPERSRSERDEFRRQIHENFNEHTLAAAEQLFGQVKANRLNETFDWRIIERTGEQVCLEAIPRDEMERLFYGSLQVSLEAESGIPVQLIIVGRNRNRQIVWQSDRGLKNEIEMVHFENDVPPAPKTLIKTAEARVK